MKAESINVNRFPRSNNDEDYKNYNKGTVSEINGTLIKCHFDSLPQIGTVLKIPSRSLSMQVASSHKNHVQALLLTQSDTLCRNETVIDTRSPVQVPLGKSLLGRTLNSFGQPIDPLGPTTNVITRNITTVRNASLQPFHSTTILSTGIKIIDVLFPIFKGSKVAVVGSNGIGKSHLIRNIVDSIKTDNISIYCGIGLNRSVIDEIVQNENGKAIHVVSQTSEPPAAKLNTLYTALTHIEYFRDDLKQNVVLFVDNVYRFEEASSYIGGLLEKNSVEYQEIQDRITSTKEANVTLIQSAMEQNSEMQAEIVMKSVSAMGFRHAIDIEKSRCDFTKDLHPLHAQTRELAMELLQTGKNSRARRLENYFTQPTSIPKEVEYERVSAVEALQDVHDIIHGKYDSIPEHLLLNAGSMETIKKLI
jgi:F-type H+-transporting ATPase subunit beta